MRPATIRTWHRNFVSSSPGKLPVFVVRSLQQIYPEASMIGCGDGMYHIHVEPGRFLIVDNDDISSDRHQIVRSVIERAKKGDLLSFA